MWKYDDWNAPASREWRYDLVADLESLDICTGFYHYTGKLMTHNEASARLLVSAVDMELAARVSQQMDGERAHQLGQERAMPNLRAA